MTAADLGRPDVEPDDELRSLRALHWLGCPGAASTAGGLLRHVWLHLFSQNDLVAEAQVDRASRLAWASTWASTPSSRGQAVVPVLRAQPHLDAVDRVEHRALGPAHVDLGDLPSQRAAGAQQERADAARSPAAARGPGRCASATRSSALSPLMTGSLGATARALGAEQACPPRRSSAAGPRGRA